MKRRLIASYFPTKKALPSSDRDEHSSRKNPSSISSPPQSQESNLPTYVDCPYCQITFPSQFIHLHLSVHDNISNNLKKSPGEEQSFDHPLKYLIANQRLLTDLHLYFILELSEERIFPQIYLSSEFHEKYSLSDFLWSAEVNLRNFDGNIPPIGSSSSPLPRKCLLTLVTNILPRVRCEGTPKVDRGDGEDPRFGSSSPMPPDPSEISILKSMIQKAFRRGLDLEGAHISFQILLRSPEEFLRRLPIILIEDGFLHWSYPILIWLMMALSKGYSLPFPLLLICLHVYIEGALGKYQDIICGTSLDEPKVASPHAHYQILASLPDLKLSPQRTIISSILLRAAYGGMGGDMQMLRHSVAQWTTRFDLLSSSSPSTSHRHDVLQTTSPPVSPNNLHLYLHQQYLSSLSPYFQFSLPDLTAETISCFLPAIEEFIQRSLPLLNSTSSLSALNHLTDSFLSNHLRFDPTRHLIPEGIDFHCDSQMIPSLARLLNTSPDLHAAYQKWFGSYFEKRSETDRSSKLQLDSQQSYLRATIWLFRSSINLRNCADWSHLPSPGDPAVLERMNSIRDHEIKVSQLQKEETLKEKAKFAGLWRIICPLVNEYSSKKLLQLRETLFLPSVTNA